MSARSEPLLWVQLIGAGLFPAEALLLLVLLAGSDPGPVPALERLLCWSLGVLAPALLLWRRPADVWSVLLLQTPLRGRRPLQQRLSRLQDALPPRVALVLGGALSLPLLWWLDDHAAMAGSIAPLAGSPRLVLLVLAALLLAVMLWQWQQLFQAVWLLGRTPAQVAAAEPMTTAELEESRLCLGLPLLLLDPLSLEVTAAPAGATRPQQSPPDTATPADGGEAASLPPTAEENPGPEAGATPADHEAPREVMAREVVPPAEIPAVAQPDLPPLDSPDVEPGFGPLEPPAPSSEQAADAVEASSGAAESGCAEPAEAGDAWVDGEDAGDDHPA